MEVKLIVTGGKRAGQEVPVPHSKFLIGRAEDCHLRPGSDLVSRHHAVILVEEGFVAVRDFGSKNGTLVNGERINREQELKTGDHLKIGPLEFEVRLDIPVAGKARPKVRTVQEAAARTVETVSSAADEVDISDWIDDEDASPEGETAETPPAEAAPTVGVQAADTAAVSKPDESDQPKGGKDRKEKKPASFAARLEEAKKRAAADSGSAADDVLRRFLGRKS